MRSPVSSPTRRERTHAGAAVNLAGPSALTNRSPVRSIAALEKAIDAKPPGGTFDSAKRSPTSCPPGSMNRLTRPKRAAIRRSALLANPRNRPPELPLSSSARKASVLPPAPRRGRESSTTTTSRLLGASASTTAALGGTSAKPKPRPAADEAGERLLSRRPRGSVREPRDVASGPPQNQPEHPVSTRHPLELPARGREDEQVARPRLDDGRDLGARPAPDDKATTTAGELCARTDAPTTAVSRSSRALLASGAQWQTSGTP